MSPGDSCRLIGSRVYSYIELHSRTTLDTPSQLGYRSRVFFFFFLCPALKGSTAYKSFAAHTLKSIWIYYTLLPITCYMCHVWVTLYHERNAEQATYIFSSNKVHRRFSFEFYYECWLICCVNPCQRLCFYSIIYIYEPCNLDRS